MTDYFQIGTFNTDRFGISWHKKELGTEPIADSDNVTDAMSKAKMIDIQVGKYPTYIVIGDQKIETEDKRLVMTNVPWTDNGIQDLERNVSWYEPINNSQYATILDPLTKHYPVAGVLMCGKYGEVLAVQMEMPEYEIGGQEQELHKPFLLVAENRKSGLKTYGTVHTRVVCQNTYNAAIGEKGNKSLPNSLDSYAILQFRTRIEKKAIESNRQYVDGLNYLFIKKIGNKEIDNLITELFPKPNKPQMVKLWEDNQDILNGDAVSQTIDERGQRAANLYQNAIDRNKKYERELIENFFRFNDSHAYAGATAYALFQATTEFYNHSEYWQSEQDTHMYNLHFGDKAKQMAVAWQVLTK